VVVESFRDASIIRVVGVIIVAAVLVIVRIYGLHAKRPAKELVGNLESTASVLRVEQLRSDNHGNREVAAELVVGPFTTGARAIHVLVDAATVHDGRVHVVLSVVGGVCRTDEFSPFHKRGIILPRGT